MNKAILSRPRILLVIRAILVYKEKLLLIQRSKNDPSDPGKWEIPGGKMDKGQDVNHAIERELIEEVGIYGQPIKNLVYFDSDFEISNKYKGIPYLRITGLYQSQTEKVRLSSEHDSYKWVKFDEALQENLTEFTKISLLAWESELNNLNL